MAYQKEHKREQILEQGIQLMMRNGYHGTGVKLLLDQVNVPKGSFYSYFESKEKFTAEAISHYIAPFINKLETYLDDPTLDGYSAIKQYFADLTINLEQSDLKDGCLLGDLMGEIGSCSDLCRLSLKSAIEQYCSSLEKGLVSAQQQGMIRSDIAAATMARVIFDSWQGALLSMKVEQSTLPLQRFSTEILQRYINK
jgi:TetR/AcrR family transcriptional repressor of nem operon